MALSFESVYLTRWGKGCIIGLKQALLSKAATMTEIADWMWKVPTSIVATSCKSGIISMVEGGTCTNRF